MFCCVCSLTTWTSNKDTPIRRLTKDLLWLYDPNVRPVLNFTEALNLTHYFLLQQVSFFARITFFLFLLISVVFCLFPFFLIFLFFFLFLCFSPFFSYFPFFVIFFFFYFPFFFVIFVMNFFLEAKENIRFLLSIFLNFLIQFLKIVPLRGGSTIFSRGGGRFSKNLKKFDDIFLCRPN